MPSHVDPNAKLSHERWWTRGPGPRRSTLPTQDPSTPTALTTTTAAALLPAASTPTPVVQTFWLPPDGPSSLAITPGFTLPTHLF